MPLVHTITISVYYWLQIYNSQKVLSSIQVAVLHAWKSDFTHQHQCSFVNSVLAVVDYVVLVTKNYIYTSPVDTSHPGFPSRPCVAKPQTSYGSLVTGKCKLGNSAYHRDRKKSPLRQLYVATAQIRVSRAVFIAPLLPGFFFCRNLYTGFGKQTLRKIWCT